MTKITTVPDWFGDAARSIAYVPVIMGIFMLVYGLWWVFVEPLFGGAFFALLALLAAWYVYMGIRQIRHASQFAATPSKDGDRMSKQFALLSTITYPTLWVGVIALWLTGNYIFIMAWIWFVIGLHFIPQAKILSRKIDYALGPLTVAFSLIGAWLALGTDSSWALVFSVSGIGGMIATGTYGLLMIRGYRVLAQEAGVSLEIQNKLEKNEEIV